MSDNLKNEIEVDDLLGDIDKNIKNNLMEKNGLEDNAQINNDNSKQQNMEKNSNKDTINNDEKIEVEDRGINTDELPPEELQKLVDSNQELIEANEEEYSKEYQEEKIRIQKELTEELNKKNEIYELLIKSNNELKSKIEMSNKKYNEIIQRIEEKKQDSVEQKIALQIQEYEKEITANNIETERYKKLIEQLKNKLDFKINLERSSNYQSILREETMKNKELKEQLNSLTRLNKVQSQYIKNYDKENQISNKMDILKKEIQQTKESIKEYQTKCNKLDKFIKLIHEKIISIEMIIKKEKTNKEEPKKKIFSKEELRDTVDSITNLKNQITEKRNQLNMITKQNDTKISKMMAQNKQLEADYKESERVNKMLIFKRNELKRNIKNLAINGANSSSNKNKKTTYFTSNINNKDSNNNNNNEINDNNNMNLEKELENDAEFHEPNVNENNDNDKNDDINNNNINDDINNDINNNEGQQKLFGKNPNKQIEVNIEDKDNFNNENDNIEEDNDAIENADNNVSNINMNDNDMNNNNIIDKIDDEY